MRIIAGIHKGRRLKTPDWSGLRPTSDRLRETFFNVVSARVPGARVLDGFAGTGAVGIEAISRGAREVVFVEQDPRARRLIEDNLGACRITGGYAIVARAFRAAVPGSLSGGFDLVFLDPPYDFEEVRESLELAGRRLAAGGLLALEHAVRRDAPDAVPGLTRVRRLVAGDSALSFYEGGPPARDASEGDA